MINYRHYRLTNRAADIEQVANLSLYKVKRKVDLLYPTLEPFSGKTPMEILGFLATIAKVFHGQQMSEGLASIVLCLFLTVSQTAYTNVVYPGPHDPNRRPIIG